jgi:hypothetical protein
LRRLLPLFLLACTVDEAPPAEATRTCDAGAEQIGVLTSVVFARPDEQGQIAGFDLDHDATGFGGTGGCGVQDDVSPDGVQGVDSAFARLLPALALTEAQAVEEIMQELINSGQVLIMWDLHGLDDLESDTCATVELLRGQDAPMIGGRGFINPGQTFDVLDGFTPIDAGQVSIQDGTFQASGFDFDLPFSFLGTYIDFVLHDAVIRVTLQPDGSFTGMLGGGISIEDVFRVASENNIDTSIVELLRGLVGPIADLAPDANGACTQISVTLTFTGVPAFLYESPALDTADSDPPTASDTDT